MADPFLAPEMIWIADGKIHGYRTNEGRQETYDGEKWVPVREQTYSDVAKA